jgi:hypothetical protein
MGDMSKLYSAKFVESKVNSDKYFAMKKRIELIESKVRFGQFFTDPKDEFFLQVKTIGEDTFALV